MADNAVVYRGPSLLTGDPILVAVSGVTYASANTKTGPVAQAYILHARQSPIEAVRSGGDRAICGDCPLRGNETGAARGCYVEWYRGPQNVWKGLPGYQERLTPAQRARWATEALAGRVLRLGAYGDPAAVPAAVWWDLVTPTRAWLGYTHQWRRFPELRLFCMASVDTEVEAREARAAGWRYFRVGSFAGGEQRLLDREIICPASDEGGHRVTCEQCRLCMGASKVAKDIRILPHGYGARLAKQGRLAL